MDSVFDRISPALQTLGLEGMLVIICLIISRGRAATEAWCVLLSVNYRNCDIGTEQVKEDGYVLLDIQCTTRRIYKYMT